MLKQAGQTLLVIAIILFLGSVYWSWQKLVVNKDYTIYLKEEDVPSAENVMELLKTEYFNKNI